MFILGEGRGREAELRRGSSACNSRWDGRRGSIGAFLVELEDCGLLTEEDPDELGRFNVCERWSLPSGALANLFPSFFLLERVDGAAVVWLRTIFWV